MSRIPGANSKAGATNPISLLVETDSLFLATGNLALWIRKRTGILYLIRRGEPEAGEIP